MFITNLTQVGEIYLVLTKSLKEGRTRITIKNGEEKPFDNVLIDSTVKISSIYKYLLTNWPNKKCQIFLNES